MDKRIIALGVLLLALLLIRAACRRDAPAPITEPPGQEPAGPALVTVDGSGEETEGTEAVAADVADSGPVEKVQVRWFVGLGGGDDPAQVTAQNEVVEEFNATHPNIELLLEVVPADTARDVLSTRLASGNPPDIVGPIGVAEAEAFHGQWLDLAPLIERSNYDLSQYDEGAVDFYKVGNEGQVGIPFSVSPSAVFYQRQMFDEAGLNYLPNEYAEPYVWSDGTQEEWTFGLLRELALLLTLDENGNNATSEEFDAQAIVQYGYEPQGQDLRAVGSYFGAGRLVADDGTTAQIPPAWADGWRWLYEGIWTDHFIASDAVRQSDAFGGGNLFNSGRVAMALTHLHYICCLPDAGDRWEVGAVPSHSGQATANFSEDTFRIMKATQHPDEAFEVLAYLLGDASVRLLDIYGDMPARIETQKVFLDRMDEQFTQAADWQVFIDGMAHADNPSFESYMPNHDEALDYVVTFTSNLATTGGLDMDAELARFVEELQAIFDQAN